MTEKECLCPDAWFEIVAPDGTHEGYNCPSYQSCGGWTWDPPCGGCDDCILAQWSYYDDFSFKEDIRNYTMWRNAQVMNA